MIGTEFRDYIRFLTKTNTGTFTDAEVILIANTVKDDMATMIVDKGEDYFGMPFTRALVADQREYPLPATSPNILMSNIKHVEIKNDADPAATKFTKMLTLDLEQYDRSNDEQTIRDVFSGLQPHYDVFRNSLWLYTGDPIVTVVDGLKVWGPQWPANLVISSLAGTVDLSIDPSPTVNGFPREFHELWGRKTAITWKEAQPGGQKLLTPYDLRWEADMNEKLDEISPRSKTEELIGRLQSTDIFSRVDTGHNN